jgi:CheY-like chemotaxis protein
MSIQSEKSFKSFSFQTPSLLVIEENIILRKMLRCMLQLLGVSCICVNSVEEAIEVFEQGVDMLIMDLYFSQCSGCDLTEHMRAYEEQFGRHTPIIGNISSVDPEYVRELCVTAGMDEVYPKMTSVQDVYEIVKQWLARPLVMPVHMWDVHVPAKREVAC